MNKIGKVQVKCVDAGNQYVINLRIIKFEEEGISYIHAPALDIFGYGKNDMEAKKSFQIHVKEFIKYTIDKGTLGKELKRLGWN